MEPERHSVRASSTDGINIETAVLDKGLLYTSVNRPHQSCGSPDESMGSNGASDSIVNSDWNIPPKTRYVALVENKAIAAQLLRGKKKSLRVGTLKLATAIRVAGHRLGGVLTVQKQKKGFLLVKSKAKVLHRSKVKTASDPRPQPSVPHPATLVHTSIRRSFPEVYAFVSNPKNMSKWAAGLSHSPLKPKDGQWIAKSTVGTVKIKFTPRNLLGVVDHDVTLPNKQTVNNPLRVQKNGLGTEVIFTLYRLPGVSVRTFIADAAKVRADLKKLKSLMEEREMAETYPENSSISNAGMNSHHRR